VSGEFPGVEVKPVVRHLDLIAIDDLLFEDAVTVPQAVTPGRVIQTCKAVEEAGGQAAQTAIAQGSVVLLLDNILDPEAELGETS